MAGGREYIQVTPLGSGFPRRPVTQTSSQPQPASEGERVNGFCGRPVTQIQDRMASKISEGPAAAIPAIVTANRP